MAQKKKEVAKHPEQVQPSESHPRRRDFNYRLAELFLKNTRLTILSIIVLILAGVATLFLLKTTGFPNPELKFAQITAVYPGASSETIVRDITQPLEGAIKNVEGVKTFQSNSANSFATIFVTIEEDANADSVRSKIDSAVKSIDLPSGAETPLVSAPEISGPDLIVSIAHTDAEKVYNVTERFIDDLNQIPETSKVTPIIELTKKVVVELRNDKLKKSGVTTDQVKTQLQSWGESLPIVTNVEVDGEQQTLLTTVTGKSLDDLKAITFTVLKQQAPVVVSPLLTPVPQPPKQESYKLEDIARIKTVYQFADDQPAFVGLNDGDAPHVVPAVTLMIQGISGTSSSVYNKKVTDLIKTYDDVVFSDDSESPQYDSEKVLVLENYSVDSDNQAQVKEVLNGLIGGPLDISDKNLAQIGWALGGIQLVFLVMIALVSWRAALISALAIPLSLVFSTIYVYAVGEDLNTLVLFSLVLVIGLVVDPALVMLESLQRKMDAGLKGVDAALAAVKDVGMGLFLAMLTNVIVFFPFAVISGVMGQIFRYIPLTIIPAVVGSYIVPIIFLAWIGSVFLRRTKASSNDEIHNLWPIARWFIVFNRKLLNSWRLVRLAVVLVVLFVIPFAVAGYYFGTGQVKQVQFASSPDSALATVSGTFRGGLSNEKKKQITEEVLQTVSQSTFVESVYPIGEGFSYYINLTDQKQREGTVARDLVNDLDEKLQQMYRTEFFDLQASLLSVGPPDASYQVTLQVQTSDLDILKTAALDINKTAHLVCYKDNKVTIDETCAGGEKIVTKVDDGYTDKENRVIEIQLKRNQLNKRGFVIDKAPLGFLVNQQIKERFVINDDKKVGTITLHEQDIEIFLESDAKPLNTIQRLEEFKVTSLTGQSIELGKIATIVETTPKSNIQRVDGQTVGIVQIRLAEGYTDQTKSALVNQALIDYYKENDGARTTALGLEQGDIDQYSQGDMAEFNKSFQDLLLALVLAVVLTYLVLVLFFKSFTQPVVILFTIPLTFMGIFPALAHFSTGELGFLEIIGIIILIGIVENVAIFLLDSANQRIHDKGIDEKQAIAEASGLRLRPIIMTTITTFSSLVPLAILSDFYRNIALVLIFGIAVSGVVSLFTTPILYVYFKWLSREFSQLNGWNKMLFIIGIPVFPIFLIYMIILGLRQNSKGLDQWVGKHLNHKVE